jgi:hypothetical protein
MVFILRKNVSNRDRKRDVALVVAISKENLKMLGSIATERMSPAVCTPPGE